MLSVYFFSLKKDKMVKVYIRDLADLSHVNDMFEIDFINHFLKVEDAKL